MILSASACRSDDQRDPTGFAGAVNKRVAALAARAQADRLTVGAHLSVAATATDAAGHTITNGRVVWQSSNPVVATVSQNGTVTGHTAGDVLLVASSGGVSDTLSLTVSSLPVAQVEIAPAALQLMHGQMARLAAFGRSADGTVLEDYTATWASSDERVAGVSADGVVTGGQPGAASVTATVGGLSATGTVTVTLPGKNAMFIDWRAAAISVGGKLQLSIVTTNGAGYQHKQARGSATWTSSNTAVATVSISGQVIGVGAGEATITASAGGQSAVATVRVTPPAVAAVEITPDSAQVLAGETAQLAATASTADGQPIADEPIVWASSNTAVATVSSTGLLTAVGAGSATVSASADNRSATAAVKVQPKAKTLSLSVSPTTLSLTVSGTGQLSAQLTDDTGSPVDGQTVTWTSSSTAVATVSGSGLVAGVSAGNATITASSNGLSAAAAVSVTAAAPAPPSEPSPSPAPTSPSTPVGSFPSKAELPRETIDTRYAAPTGRTLRVPAGGDLQAALNDAQPGDEVVLASGATFTGNFVLPKKSGSSWVTVRSDAGIPAEGTRVSPQTAAGFAKILTPNSAPALATAPGAHHYRLLGLEVSSVSSVTVAYALLALGDGSGAQNDLSLVPFNLVVDRSFIHGTPTLDLRRCVAMNSAWTAVIDSYVSECHSKGFDSQAVWGWNGPGPFKIENNYLEGAGQNVGFGGADPAIVGLVPSDIVIRRNYLRTPPSWRGVWLKKCLYEIKNAQRVLFEGNVLDGSWPDGWAGEAMVLKASGDASWTVGRDLTVRYNKVINATAGIVIAKQAINQPERIQIEHNWLNDVPGRAFLFTGAMRDIALAHNTGGALDYRSGGGGNSSWLTVDQPVPGAVIVDNVGLKGDYGIFGAGSSEGSLTISQFFSGGVVAGNVFIGADATRYPTGNFFPAAIPNVPFVSYPTDARLASSSLYLAKATDGTNPGVNFDTLFRLIQGVVP